MTAQKTGEAPACKMTRLNADIEQRLDFAFSPAGEDHLLTMRSLLGLVRRLLYVCDNYDSMGTEPLPISLRREPKCVGSRLREIVADASYTVDVSERTGRSVMMIKGASRADLESLIAGCLSRVEEELSE